MKITKINLRKSGTERCDSTLDAVIKENGDLVLDGYDTGDFVEEIFGDDDYEYWVTVSAEYKDTILLHLIAEHFESETVFSKWLEEKGIPHKFETF